VVARVAVHHRALTCDLAGERGAREGHPAIFTLPGVDLRQKKKDVARLCAGDGSAVEAAAGE
jgi:hypothetical protein